jgi:hypothetical protein
MKAYIVPNGFSMGEHSGRPERWSRDGSRWVTAEPSRYGFCVWGYDDDTPEVVCLGQNLSGREVERLADLFLAGGGSVRGQSLAQRGAVSVEATIWIAGYLLAILGLVKAVYSQQHLLWLAVWPAPVVLAATIFVFVRQGFHFQNGVLVLGRRHLRD